MPTNIKNRIKKIRQDLSLTQKALAETLGVKWYQIKDIETGKTKPSIDIIISMCEKFAIDSNWILTGQKTENINHNYAFKAEKEGMDAIAALLEIENINERTFRRTVADLKYIADKLKEGASPGDLISVPESNPLGEF